MNVYYRTPFFTRQYLPADELNYYAGWMWLCMIASWLFRSFSYQKKKEKRTLNYTVIIVHVWVWLNWRSAYRCNHSNRSLWKKWAAHTFTAIVVAGKSAEAAAAVSERWVPFSWLSKQTYHAVRLYIHLLLLFFHNQSYFDMGV